MYTVFLFCGSKTKANSNTPTVKWKTRRHLFSMQPQVFQRRGGGPSIAGENLKAGRAARRSAVQTVRDAVAPEACPDAQILRELNQEVLLSLVVTRDTRASKTYRKIHMFQSPSLCSCTFVVRPWTKTTHLNRPPSVF